MRRLILPAALAALLLSSAPALAKNGVEPVSPKRGDTVPAGKSVTFKMNIRGDHSGVFVHICRSKQQNRVGMICHSPVIGQARKKRGVRFEYKAKLYDYPEFWLNTPGTYYWQAYRTYCKTTTSDCKAEGPIVKFKVG
jgi:hypothetical protein